MTKEERHLWYDFLKNLPVMVHRQKIIGQYIADFYIAEKKIVIELDGSQHYSTGGGMDFSWSPDSKWFVISYTGNRHDPYSDVGIVSAQGGQIHNLTNTGYFDESPQWVMGGNAIVFSTDRFGMRSHASWGSQNDIMIIFLNRKSYELAHMSKEDYELYKEAAKVDYKSQKELDAAIVALTLGLVFLTVRVICSVVISSLRIVSTISLL